MYVCTFMCPATQFNVFLRRTTHYWLNSLFAFPFKQNVPQCNKMLYDCHKRHIYNYVSMYVFMNFGLKSYLPSYAELLRLILEH